MILTAEMVSEECDDDDDDCDDADDDGTIASTKRKRSTDVFLCFLIRYSI